MSPSAEWDAGTRTSRATTGISPTARLATECHAAALHGAFHWLGGRVGADRRTHIGRDWPVSKASVTGGVALSALPRAFHPHARRAPRRTSGPVAHEKPWNRLASFERRPAAIFWSACWTSMCNTTSRRPAGEVDIATMAHSLERDRRSSITGDGTGGESASDVKLRDGPRSTCAPGGGRSAARGDSRAAETGIGVPLDRWCAGAARARVDCSWIAVPPRGLFQGVRRAALREHSTDTAAHYQIWNLLMLDHGFTIHRRASQSRSHDPLVLASSAQ